MGRSQIGIINEVKHLAVEYHKTWKKPLGVTGEIAEVIAAETLGLVLCPPRQEGYDALRNQNGLTEKIQIKGRWKRESKGWGRVSAINTDKDFDIVMLVLMQGDYELFAIHEMTKDEAKAFLDRPGSKARNERRSMGVSQFISQGRQVWPVA